MHLSGMHIETYGDMTSAAQVSALTEKPRPYLLRRTKGDVDLGLTPMEETLLSVEITNNANKRSTATPRSAAAQICHR